MNVNLTPRPIVVGFDGSGPSEAAVRWAAREAMRQGRLLRILHTHWFSVAPVLPGQLVPTGELVQNAQAVAETALALARDVAPELEVTAVAGEERPAHALVRESEHAELVVLGARGLGGFAGLLLGSVSHEVAAHARCPVVILRDDDQPNLTSPADSADLVDSADLTGSVVVGVDGSEGAELALEFAFGYASTHGRSVLAVRAWVPYYLEAALVAAPMFGDWRADLDSGREGLRLSLAPWRVKYPEVSVEERVVVGPAARALVRLSSDATLLVVGTRGRGEIASLALGSVSHAALHGATCPVALVRSTGR